MVTEVRPEQPENAEFPILVTLLGMVTEVRPEQPENAEFPILVTLLGIVMVVSLEAIVFANAFISTTCVLNDRKVMT
jgi:hypothetical protein